MRYYFVIAAIQEREWHPGRTCDNKEFCPSKLILNMFLILMLITRYKEMCALYFNVFFFRSNTLDLMPDVINCDFRIKWSSVTLMRMLLLACQDRTTDPTVSLTREYILDLSIVFITPQGFSGCLSSFPLITFSCPYFLVNGALNLVSTPP